MDFIRIVTGRIVLNFIGVTLRWTFGILYQITIFQKEKYTFSEYLNEPNPKKGSYDEVGHKLNNKIIGAVFLVTLISVLIKIL